MKKLAVLMPSYNAAAYLKESIDSILNQTFADFDLYVYDDCSNDDTKELISGYKDTRLFYRKNLVNSGIAKTLNKGLEELLPHYEYIARMDADDWAYPERFQKQIGFLDSHQEVVLCGTQGFWLKDIYQSPVSDWIYPVRDEYIRYYLLFAASFGHSSIVYRSEPFHRQNLRYNESIETCEDWDLWIRVLKIGPVANLPDFMMKYRILEESKHRSSENIKKHLEERTIIISDYWADFGIILKPEEVYYYYYGNQVLSPSNFKIKIKVLIPAFNLLHANARQYLVLEERINFSYLLTRRILDYWKRSNVNRFNPLIWAIIVKEVKFMNTVKLIKSLIR